MDDKRALAGLAYVESQCSDESPFAIPWVLTIEGSLDVARLLRAIERTLLSHSLVGRTYDKDRGEIIRDLSICGDRTPDVVYIDRSTVADPVDYVRTAIATLTLAPLRLDSRELVRVKLFVIPGAATTIFVNIHHALFDGRSMQLFIDDLERAYTTDGASCPSRETLPPLRQDDSSVSSRDVEEYWSETLAGYHGDLELPGKARPILTFHGARLEGAGLMSMESARERVRERNVTLPCLGSAATALVLFHIGQKSDVAFGTPFDIRSSSDASHIGYLVRFLPLRLQVSKDMTVSDMLENVMEQWLGGLEHRAADLGRIIELWKGPVREGSHQLLQVAYSYEDFCGQCTFAGHPCTTRLAFNETAKFDLEFKLEERDGKVLASLVFNSDRFDRSTANAWLRLYERAVAFLLGDVNQSLASFTALDEDELAVFSGSPLSDPAARSADLFPGVIEEHLRSKEGKAAIFDGDTMWRWSDLESVSHVIACHIASHRARRVLVLLPRSRWHIAAFCAVWRAGSCLIPVPLDVPAARLEGILRDTTPDLVVTDAQQRDRLSGICEADRVLFVEDCQMESAQFPAPTAPSPSDDAMILYTSGTTGQPNGVFLSYESWTHLVEWYVNTIGMDCSSRSTSIAPLGFDGAIVEALAFLCSGGSLLVVPDSAKQNTEELISCLVEKEVTHTFVPTALANEVLPAQWPTDTRLQWLVCGGSRLNVHSVSHLPFRVFNGYGPCECTAFSSVNLVEPGCSSERMIASIGRPLPGWRIVIKGSATDQAVPIGVPGEIYVGGVGVGRGYLNRPEVTESRFVKSEDGELLYRTGDLAVWDADGRIHYLGRRDQQVKVSGYRVELDEVRSVIERELSLERVVCVFGQANGDSLEKLWAFSCGQPAPADWRERLKHHLPEYMIPRDIREVARIPLSTNEKIRPELLLAEIELSQAARTGIAAMTTAGERLLQKIRALLSAEPDAARSLLAMGMRSLEILQLSGFVKRDLNLKLPTKVLFSTIGELVSYVDKQSASEQHQGPSNHVEMHAG